MNEFLIWKSIIVNYISTLQGRDTLLFFKFNITILALREKANIKKERKTKKGNGSASSPISFASFHIVSLKSFFQT